MREIEPVLSPYKEKGLPPPCKAGIEHAILRSPDTRLLDNKNGKVEKALVATGIIVTLAAAGKKPDAIVSSIETFNSRLWNRNQNRSWRMNFGYIRYGLVTKYNNSVVDAVFFQIFTR